VLLEPRHGGGEMTREEGQAVRQAWKAVLLAVESANGTICAELDKLLEVAAQSCESAPGRHQIECSIHSVQERMESLKGQLEAVHRRLVGILALAEERGSASVR
jgi:hypothetical protein